ncbi:MAG: hypothetical protein HY747_04955 [Elusimicrobia bacterium]|nr:hypothetical protein [Elusimicrobiota bacterium]
MKYKELLTQTRRLPAFRFQDLRPRKPLLAHEHTQIYGWVKEGRFIRLRQGLYALNNEERRAPISPFWLAGKLYWPSYVSLEYALSFYGFIPEAVGRMTCVTTLKTKIFKNPFGIFAYHKVQPHGFFGYHTQKSQEAGQSYWIADPEKALLDFIYLSIPRKLNLSPELFLDSYRLQNLEEIKRSKLKDYILRFQNPRVREGGEILLKIIGKRNA